MVVMSLRPGLSGLVLLRLLLRMLLVFSGGQVPLVGVWFLGVVMARSQAWFGLVGHQVRKVRSNAVDVHDAADVFSCTVIPLLLLCLI